GGDMVSAAGAARERALATLAQAMGQPPPALEPVELQTGEAVAWFRRGPEPPFSFRSEPPRAARQRHHRKYAEGELGPDLSFYFRGPEGKLNLRAQNLPTSLHLPNAVTTKPGHHHLANANSSTCF